MTRQYIKTAKVLFAFLFISLLFYACQKQSTVTGDSDMRKVKGTVPVARELPDETGGFGALSFLSKVDISAPQDGVIKKIYYREGDFVKQGTEILLLENLQINLAVERAENNYSQALAACELARSRLLEGRFNAEAQLLALEKAGAELVLVKRK